VSTENVGIKVTADTSQAKREAGGLAKTFDQLGLSSQRMGQGFTGMVDSMAGGLAKFNLAMGGAQKAFDGFRRAMDVTNQVNSMKMLERSLPIGQLQRMERASSNALSKWDALRLSNRALTGDFKITAQQLDVVTAAAAAAERKGIGPAADNLERMLKAIQEKDIAQLGRFGIQIKSTGDQLTDVNNAMVEFKKLVSETEPESAQADAMGKLAKSFENVGHAIKGAVAAAVNGLAQLMQELHAGDGGGFWAQLIEGAYGGGGAVRIGANRARAMADEANRLRETREAFEGAASRELAALTERDNAERMKLLAGAGGGGMAGAATARRKKRSATGGGAYVPDGLHVARDRDVIAASMPDAPMMWHEFIARQREGRAIYDATGSLGEGMQGSMSGFAGRDMGSVLGSSIGAAGAFSTGSLQAQLGGGQTGLGGYQSDNAMGSFLDSIAQKSELAGGALGAFASGMHAAIEAAVAGGDGIGKAFAKATSAALKAKAVEWGVMAAGEGAWALSSLAFGDLRGAAQHGAAAAKFAAAAAAAGVGAAAVGSMAGGGGASGGAGGGGGYGMAGGGYARPGGSGGGAGDTIVVNMGDGFYGDRHQVVEAIGEGVRQAKRLGQREGYTTSFSGG
jgi:hypothetical protein